MKKNFLVILVATALQACTSFPAAVLPDVPNLEPDAEAPNNARSMFFSSVNSRLENRSVGQMKIGNACVNEKENLWPNNPLVNDMFRDAIIDELSKLGYPIPTDTLDFKNQEAAEILIGAKVLEIAANICSAPAGFSGDVVLTVEWTIYDKTSDKTLVLTSLGKGHVPELIRDGSTELYGNAMAHAAKNLASSTEFNQFVAQ